MMDDEEFNEIYEALGEYLSWEAEQEILERNIA